MMPNQTTFLFKIESHVSMDEKKSAVKSIPESPGYSPETKSEPLSVVDQIRRTLSCLGYAQLNAVQCVLDGDEVLLTGKLDSFYLKQVAQSVAIKIPGVRNVRNEIQVV